MKTLSLILLFSLVFVSFACLGQDKEWKVLLTLNSIAMDYPDQFNTSNSGVPWLDQFELYSGNDFDKSFSVGIGLQYGINKFFYRLRFDITSIDVYTDNYYYMQNQSEHFYSSKKRKDFFICPGLGWQFKQESFSAFSGFNVPIIIRGDADVYHKVEDFDSNGINTYSRIMNGTVNYGTSYGIGIFLGFDYVIAKSRISVGGEISGSFSHYVNEGISNFDGQDIYPNNTQLFSYTKENNSSILGFKSPDYTIKISYRL